MLAFMSWSRSRILAGQQPACIRDAAKREPAEAGEYIGKWSTSDFDFSDGWGRGAGGLVPSGKAAVIGLTRTMAKERGRYRVNLSTRSAFGLIERD